MKITIQLSISAVLLLASALINVSSVYYFLDRMQDDATVVNQAGIVRGASQRLIKLELLGIESDDLITDIDLRVNGLLKGDRSLGLPPARDPNFISKQQITIDSWQSLKLNIYQFRENTTTTNELLPASESFFAMTNEAVFAAENFSQRKVKNLKLITVMLFGLNLLVLGVIFWLTWNLQQKLKDTIQVIATSSTEIASTSHEQEIIMEKLQLSSQSSVDNANQVADSAFEVRNCAQNGSDLVEKTVGELATLREHIQQMRSQIVLLGEKVSQIGYVSSLAGDLAAQTNVLAINAAIEAMRDADRNQGFIVIAREIRQIANQSQDSAAKIKVLVLEIEQAIQSAVLGTKKCTELSQGCKQFRPRSPHFKPWLK